MILDFIAVKISIFKQCCVWIEPK